MPIARFRRHLAPVVLTGIAWSVFQLYTALAGFYPAIVQRSVHVGFALTLAFLLYPLRPSAAQGEDAPASDAWGRGRWINLLLSTSGLLMVAYVVLNFERLTTRIRFVDTPTAADVVIGLVLTILLLEACRRITGPVLPIITVVFIAYAFAGPSLPGALGHTGMTLESFIDQQFLSVGGIFGIPTGVATEFVFYFILFAAFLKVSGGGQLFMDLSVWATRRSHGGPAKASILGSSMMGSISGSAVGNVASTGIFTIPLMTRVGYKPTFAGAVESVASTGGQLMPPIMGAAAFILAEFIGRPYVEVMAAALVPAIAYYLGVFLMVHLEARKRGLGPVGETEDSAVNADGTRDAVLRRLHLLIPLVVLVGHIVAGFSLPLSAVRSIVAVVLISFLRKATRLSLPEVLDALAQGARQAVVVSIPSATAGIIVGVISFSGVGLTLSSFVVRSAGGVLLIALLLVMISAMVLGLGMPTSGAYIMAGLLAAPALQRMGVSPMASHLFVFYFAVISMITPPVGLATIAAAGISGQSIMRTGWQGLRLALPGLIVPFAFVFHPPIILEGSAAEVAWAVSTVMAGVAALAFAIMSRVFVACRPLEVVLLWASGLLLIAPGVRSNMLGLAAGMVVIALQLARRRHSVALAGAGQ